MPNPAWAPTIASFPDLVNAGGTYGISGTQFNGLSQAVAYGDDAQAATNYPLVRIVNHATKHVQYARTHDHSTMAVATGGTIVSTQFDVPTNLEPGAADLVVVANGIPSLPVYINACDVNHDGMINIVDIQLVIDQLLGLQPPTSDINGDGQVNDLDLQIVVNAALGRGCR